MKFNVYLRELRSRKFPDTGKLSKLLKIDRNIWRKIETGINPPPRKNLLNKFCLLINCKDYEKNQLYALARKWQPSELTNTMHHTITPTVELMKKIKPEEYRKWYDAAVQENTPDYEHKYWGIQLD